MNLLNSNNFIYIFRLLLASICGIIIGLERKNRSKEAGIRTHCVVACAAALMMLISKYAFFDVIGEGMYNGVEVRLDPSRVASTIASGIGFLGAGMIFVHKNTITGLTTAAGVWATSGVGMAIGSGMYVIGIAATFIIIISQIIFHKNYKWLKNNTIKKLNVYSVNSDNFQSEFIDNLKDNNIVIHDVSISKKEEGKDFTFLIEMPNTVNEETILDMVDYKCKIINN